MTTHDHLTFRTPALIGWPTLSLLILTHLGWLAAIWLLPLVSVTLAILLAAWTIAQHSSLQHEALHGHPFGDERLNALMVSLPIGLVIPYGRFRATHLAHHVDADLTDPYDDPESNFLAEADWVALPAWRKSLMQFNNTLLGRMLVGPAIGAAAFLAGDWAARRDPEVRRAWLQHAFGLIVVLAILATSPMPVWAYALAAYLGLSLLKIRTFLEHRAHERCRGRSVVVEDCGPLALLFLNNNYHAVHHAHPQVPWYRLPGLYRAEQQRFLTLNDGYRYRSYGEIARSYLLRAKDPVEHPILRRSTPAAVTPCAGSPPSSARPALR